jgi:hypothetical protein
MNPNKNTRSLLTIRQFSDRHPAFSVSSIRALRFYQDTNGFSGAFLSLGSRVILDEDLFFQCLDGLNEKGVAA